MMELKRDDIDTPMIVLIGILSAILLFALIVMLMVWYEYAKDHQFQSKVVAEKPAELSSLVSLQQGNINAYRWVNEASQTVAIPIDIAMQKIISKNQ